MKIYIAAPFFRPYQVELVELIKLCCEQHGVEYFSPKDELLFQPGKMTPQEVIDKNVEALDRCDGVVAVTDGKDPGTLFECGYAYANHMPICYLWAVREPGQKFNIVLAATGSVAQTISHIGQCLEKWKEEDLLCYDYSAIQPEDME